MNALDVMQYGSRTFITAVQAVPQENHAEPGVCGTWSVKHIIAHVASFEILLIDVLSGFVDGGATPTLDQFLVDPVAFNDEEVLRRRDQSATETLAEYAEAHNRVIALAAEIPADVWRQPGTLPWYGAEYSLDDLIVYQYYGHKREHSAEIMAFLDRVLKSVHL